MIYFYNDKPALFPTPQTLWQRGFLEQMKEIPLLKLYHCMNHNWNILQFLPSGTGHWWGWWKGVRVLHVAPLGRWNWRPSWSTQHRLSWCPTDCPSTNRRTWASMKRNNGTRHCFHPNCHHTELNACTVHSFLKGKSLKYSCHTVTG